MVRRLERTDGASPSGKALVFGISIRRFESCRPSHKNGSDFGPVFLLSDAYCFSLVDSLLVGGLFVFAVFVLTSWAVAQSIV